ncbi:MAG: stalk domain-containing protein [Defluviitaleaceae bacterium]|nr:stalk domain-containing protein [Defluviitaleaceae bacterium]MCL2262235.1 stalk domain-containing protein [Defluviitaleaceae bacterium]
MKKCFVLMVLFTAVFAAQVYAAYGEIAVLIDDEMIFFEDQLPQIVNGRVLVPVRAVFEHMGFEVGWVAEEQLVALTRWDDAVEITIGWTVFIVNGQAIETDVAAQIIGGRTMLPVRAIMESVGYFVQWDRETSTVLISPEPFPEPELRQITIPYRKLTDEEIATWIYNYHAMGGAVEFEREVIRLTNIERIAYGLNPVDEYLTLMLAARFKAQSLYDLDYFSHTSPVYGHFAIIARQVFNKPLRSMGENLANGHQTPADVVAAWMDSPLHRDNILTPNYIRIGVGTHNNRWVQKFSG